MKPWRTKAEAGRALSSTLTAASRPFAAAKCRAVQFFDNSSTHGSAPCSDICSEFNYDGINFSLWHQLVLGMQTSGQAGRETNVQDKALGLHGQRNQPDQTSMALPVIINRILSPHHYS